MVLTLSLHRYYSELVPEKNKKSALYLTIYQPHKQGDREYAANQISKCSMCSRIVYITERRVAR